ncbi:MAG: DUF2920 family protein [Lentisphaeria bacterium]|nr:DUF2920 family protein [Lentisphaeria bacterium]
MKHFELTVPSVNSIHYAKNITCAVFLPENITATTSFALFTHGWGGNRFQHRDKIEAVCEAENRICLGVEFRMSGYDFDPVTGQGAYTPYDASFMQVFDVLNCLRHVYKLYPQVDRRRTVHYGGSQGGWIALISAIFAPRSFAAVYASSPVVHLTDEIISWAERDFSEKELLVRDVLYHADKLQTPIFLEHGTGDTTVPHHQHTAELEKLLKKFGKKHKVVYYENGGHDLLPAITKIEAFQKMRREFFDSEPLSCDDDFTACRQVKIVCGKWKLIIDWGAAEENSKLFRWEKL